MSLRAIVAATAALCVFFPAVAGAAVVNQDITINAVVGPWGKLVISDTIINFPDADPDVVTSIPATENPVNVQAKARTTSGGNSTLTCQANSDLTGTANGEVITIDNVSWTALGAGYVGGTMSTAANVPVGSWTGPGTNVGTLEFFMANSWAYEVASDYTATVTYTFTTP